MLFRRPFAWYQICAIHTKELLNIEWYSVLPNVKSLKHRNCNTYHRNIPWMSNKSPLNDSTDLEKVTAFLCIVFIHHAKAIKMYCFIILSTENMTRGSIRVYQNARCSVKWFKNSVKKEIKQTHRITVHQWMVLRWWHAFYLFYGNMECWKTDVNFSGRLRT